MLTWVLTRGWVFWVFVLIGVLIVLWIFRGGNTHEFIGISPLDPNIVYFHSPSNVCPVPIQADVDHEPDHELPKPQESFQEDVTERKPVIKRIKYVPYQSLKDTITRRKMKAEPKRSRREALCCRILEKIYGKQFERIRPDFLKNPETGYNLEIDCYNDELKIGLEFSGVQHYVYPNYTGQTLEQFIQQIRRDQFKVDMCDVNGVYLITVPYSVPDNQLEEYIRERLPENVANQTTQ